MNKRDTREWQYVKPLIKGEYKLMANVSRNVGEWELDRFRVQSIRVKNGELEVKLRAPSDFE